MDISAPETINKLGINPHTLTFNELNHTTIDGEVASVLTEETIKKCSSFQKDILTLYFKISEFENQCECFIKNESKELVNRIKFIKSLLTNLMETNSKEVVRKKRNLLKFIPLHLTKK